MLSGWVVGLVALATWGGASEAAPPRIGHLEAMDRWLDLTWTSATDPVGGIPHRVGHFRAGR